MPLQGLCFQHGIRTLPDNHRDDVAGAGAGVSLCLQGFAKRPADVCQMLAPFPHVCQPAHDKQCPSDVYGGQSGGEDKCAHAVDEVFPYHLPAYDVSACGCCRLAERADKEVDVSGAAGLLGATESLPAAHAESVGLVHVEQHIAVPAFQFCQGGQVSLIAVHAEDAFGDDDDLAKGGVVLFEQPFQLCQIVVAVADALFKIQMSIDAKKFGLNLWWRILLVAILTGVLGFLLLIRPFEAAEIMMILVGVSVLFEGILNLCVAIYTVKIIKNQKQDIIDMDEY